MLIAGLMRDCLEHTHYHSLSLSLTLCRRRAGFAFAGYKISTDEQLRGFRLGTTVSALMTAVMGYRYYTSRKVMPAVPLAALGAIGAVYHGAKYLEWSDA